MYWFSFGGHAGRSNKFKGGLPEQQTFSIQEYQSWVTVNVFEDQPEANLT